MIQAEIVAYSRNFLGTYSTSSNLGGLLTGEGTISAVTL
jgi:hypothetical protein